MIQGERYLEVHRISEENEPDPVAPTPFDEVVQNQLDGFQAIDPIPVGIGEVARVHRDGKIHPQKQIAG